MGKQTIYPILAEAEAIGFFHGRWGKDEQQIKSMISKQQALGSGTTIANGFQQDAAGQGKTDSAATHQMVSLKIT